MEQKYIVAGKLATIKTIPSEPLAKDSLYIYKINSAFKSKIDVKGDYLIVKSVQPQNLSLYASSLLDNPPTGAKKDFIDQYYFPELSIGSSTKNLVYFDTKPVLQGLSIALKIRPKLEQKALLDSFPTQAESSFNPAVALGWKLNLNIYGAKKDVFGKNIKQISLTPGVFFGTGVAELKKSNTRPVIDFERKAAITSYGGFLMLGYHTINLGYSFGWDYATGVGRKGWLYQGEMWHGITIGIDIIK